MRLSIIHMQQEKPKKNPHQWQKKKVKGVDFYSYVIFRTTSDSDYIKMLFNRKNSGIFSIKKVYKKGGTYVRCGFFIHLETLEIGTSDWAKYQRSIIGDCKVENLFFEIVN
jgi:hypothetical protein